MPWAIAFMAADTLPPCRTSFSDFLKAAHTLALALVDAHRAVKAASPQEHSVALTRWPRIPENQLRRRSRAAARYHAMNNVFLLEATMTGRYPKTFVGEPPLEIMGYKSGDDKLLYAPLD